MYAYFYLFDKANTDQAGLLYGTLYVLLYPSLIGIVCFSLSVNCRHVNLNTNKESFNP